jgi:16S rRNA (guanine(966)-N(2))-methyltransferase RsmD
MFMALEPLEGLLVVDLFSGSGALGIEALSRGAHAVAFVEDQSFARRALSENLTSLGIETRATVWPLHLPQGLKRLAGVIATADLILLDPPYGGELARTTLERLGAMHVKESVRIVVEHHGRDELPDSTGRLARTRERHYGETTVSTYGQGAGDAPAATDSGGSA